MSDPLGRHYCPYAIDVEDISTTVRCKVTGQYQSCAGLVDYCDLEEAKILKYESKQESIKEMNHG